VSTARRRGIPCFEPARPNGEEFLACASALAPDLILAVGYLNRLGGALLALPRVIAANFHASLLPAYRGKHPVFWALRNGEPWCGMTVHAMDPGLDTGDIIFQVRVRTRRTDSVSTLYDRIMDRSVALVGRLVECVALGRVPRRPQPAEGASYFSSVSDADFRLSAAAPAEKLRRWIAASPGQCWMEIGGKRLFITRAALAPRRAAAGGSPAPGTILSLARGGGVLVTAEGSLRLLGVRGADGRERPAAAALRELGLEAGSVIGP
jgi:methionyl-tRNA formyltransferase